MYVSVWADVVCGWVWMPCAEARRRVQEPNLVHLSRPCYSFYKTHFFFIMSVFVHDVWIWVGMPQCTWRSEDAFVESVS